MKTLRAARANFVMCLAGFKKKLFVKFLTL